MAALLVGMSVMAVLISVAMPVWQTAVRRERETELVFRGEQYAHAITLYQRRFAGTFPPSVDVLVQQRFLRRKYTDPITGSDFRLLYSTGNQLPTPGAGAGQGTSQGRSGTPPAPAGRVSGRGPTQPQTASVARGGIVGVTSTSDTESLREYNGRGRYNEWLFQATQATNQPGAEGGGAPGTQGRARGAGVIPPGRVGAGRFGRGPTQPSSPRGQP
jgi:type II secretory pathway pseudopilin PulG